MGGTRSLVEVFNQQLARNFVHAPLEIINDVNSREFDYCCPWKATGAAEIAASHLKPD